MKCIVHLLFFFLLAIVMEAQYLNTTPIEDKIIQELVNDSDIIVEGYPISQKWSFEQLTDQKHIGKFLPHEETSIVLTRVLKGVTFSPGDTLSFLKVSKLYSAIGCEDFERMTYDSSYVAIHRDDEKIIDGKDSKRMIVFGERKDPSEGFSSAEFKMVNALFLKLLKTYPPRWLVDGAIKDNIPFNLQHNRAVQVYLHLSKNIYYGPTSPFEWFEPYMFPEYLDSVRNANQHTRGMVRKRDRLNDVLIQKAKKQD